MELLLFDLRLAIRNLLRRKSLSVIIVLTLAVGIACTTAMFSVVRGMLLRPLPWPDSDRLAVLTHVPPGSADEVQLSIPETRDLRELLPDFELGIFSSSSATLTIDGRAETYPIRRLTPEIVEMLSVRPALGRTFAPGEFGYGGKATVVLGHALWQRHFGGAPDVLGRKLDLDGTAFEIIGILPPDYALPVDLASGERPELWVGMDLADYENWSRQTRMFPGLVRLREGLSLNEARGELERAVAELRRRHPELYGAGWKMRLVAVEQEILGGVRPALLLLFGAVFFVLMIACANVAHLLLAQNDARSGELALRSALGARRARLLLQLMLENLVLSLSGGILGTLGAFWAVDVLLEFRPGYLPRLDTVSVDMSVLLFGLGAALATAVMFGWIPALKAAGTDVRTALQRGRGTVGGLLCSRGRRLLMIFEIALATVLLSGAGLLVGTLRQLARVDLGFEPEGLVATRISLPREYASSEDVLRFWDRLRQNAATLPGVESASLTTLLPFYSGAFSRPMEIEGGAAGPQQVPRISIDRTAPRIAEALGMEVLRGRDLGEQDRKGAPLVALVNETFASYLEGDGVGQRIRFAERPWITVVGVVGDVGHGALGDPAAPRILLPNHQLEEAGGWRVADFSFLTLRTRGRPELLLKAAREALHTLDPSIPFGRTLIMDEYVAGTVMARYRFATFVLSLFAAVALGLALVGIYGLLSYLVRRGRREVGVRLALGAQRGDIRRQVSRQGWLLALAGLALGIPAALALTKLLRTILYGVEPTDPGTFVAVSLLLLAVALAASYLPARRATEVHPIEVLRSE